MSVLQNLLLLYSLLLLFNIGLSGFLWARQRTILYKQLFFLWIASTATYIAQGALQQNDFAIALGFSTAFFVSLSFAILIAEIVRFVLPFRLYFSVTAAAIAASSINYWVFDSFLATNLPVAMAVVFPLLHTLLRTARGRWDRLTPAGKTFVLSCLLLTLHQLDFPFVRDKEHLASLGFTLATLILFALSLTALATVLEQVTQDRARIEQLGEIRTKFFANISHELRTPLTLILAPLEELLSRPNLGHLGKVLEGIKRNAGRLLRFIDELLDISKLDAGGLRLQVAQVDLRALAATMYENSKSAAEAKGISLFLDAPHPTADTYGDSHRLESILTNLVGNALKYCPAGSAVTIRVRDSEDSVSLEVEDTGPGIAPADLPRLFDRFYQAPDKARRRAGVGIGLSLAKELAELHGGTLTVTSRLGQGTTFRLRLPKGSSHFASESLESAHQPAPTLDPGGAARSDESAKNVKSPGEGTEPTITPSQAGPGGPPAADESEANITAQGKATERREGLPQAAPIELVGTRSRILVAEDQDELRAFIRDLLETNYEVIEASDGDQALALVRSERPDLVLSDISMPEKDGVELCREIKTDPNLRTTPVILVTAQVGSEITLSAYGHGADDFVAKPFHPGVVLARVRAQLRLRELSLQLLSQEKFAAVGTLAAGVAHEVKNPLNSVANAARVLLAKDVDPTARKKLLEVINDGTSRIEAIVSALNTHARPADQGTTVCDVRQGLDSTLALMEHRLKGIHIERRYNTNQNAVARPSQINQVFLNLLDNALQAGAKNISLRVDKEDSRVVVRVEDDGPGIPKEIVHRIFDAFFTTRDPGAGAGLGLYLSRKIAMEQGGDLNLEKASNKGAVFRVTLPSA